MLRWIRKRLTLRSYRRKLGPSLVKRYGREPHYTVNQVRTTADDLRLDTVYLCYALADYCSREDFDAHHASTGEACDWAAMRHELDSSWGVGGHAVHHNHDAGHHHDFGGGHHHDFGGHHHDGGGFDGGGHHH